MKKSWMRSLATAFAFLGATIVTPSAQATTIDFNSASLSSVSSYSDSGVTFTPIGGGSFSTSQTPNGTAGILGDSGNVRQPFHAVIAGGAGSVSIDLGDFNADSDTLFLSIFNSSDVLLGTITQLIDGAFIGMITLSLSNPSIAYAQFGSTTPSLGGSSVYADNFTYTQVPEPSTLALIGMALLSMFGFGMMRRRADA